MSDKWGIFWTIVVGLIIVSNIGCTRYGKRISYHGETCSKCQQELFKRCTPIANDGSYKCKCINKRCGKVYKYRLGKQIKPKEVEANPKGILTPLTDEKFNRYENVADKVADEVNVK